MHDIYGTPIYTHVTENFVLYYYIHNGLLVIGEYSRRTTSTTYATTSIPKSML